MYYIFIAKAYPVHYIGEKSLFIAPVWFPLWLLVRCLPCISLRYLEKRWSLKILYKKRPGFVVTSLPPFYSIYSQFGILCTFFSTTTSAASKISWSHCMLNWTQDCCSVKAANHKDTSYQQLGCISSTIGPHLIKLQATSLDKEATSHPHLCYIIHRKTASHPQ